VQRRLHALLHCWRPLLLHPQKALQVHRVQRAVQTWLWRMLAARVARVHRAVV
jgi:hypothetical protein